MSTNILYGTDVELGFYLKENGKWLSPFKRNNQELAEHFELPEFKEYFHADGTNYEVVIPPQDNLSNLMGLTVGIIFKAANRVNCDPNFLPIQSIDYDLVSHVDEVNIFGCQPDVDFEGKDIDTGISDFKERAKGLSERPAGGHIHISAPYMFKVDNEEWESFIALFTKFQLQEDDKLILEYGNLLQEHPCWKPFISLGSTLASVLLNFSYECSLSLWKYAGASSKKHIKELENQRRIDYGKPMKSRPKLYPDPIHGIRQGIEIRSTSPVMFLADPFQSRVKDLDYVLTDLVDSFPFSDKITKEAMEYLRGFPKTHVEESYKLIIPIDHLRYPLDYSDIKLPDTVLYKNNSEDISYKKEYLDISDIMGGSKLG